MNGGLRLSQCHGNDDAFARRQTIGFDDDRCALLMNVVERRFDLGKNGIGGRRDSVPREEILGERLAPLKLRCACGRPRSRRDRAR